MENDLKGYGHILIDQGTLLHFFPEWTQGKPCKLSVMVGDDLA
jgi:hypothetical protein